MKTSSKLTIVTRSILTRTKSFIALVALVAASGFGLSALAAPGDLYVTDLATGSVLVFAPDGTQRTFATGIGNPQGIAFDQSKNLYVATAVGRILKYDLDG